MFRDQKPMYPMQTNPPVFTFQRFFDYQKTHPRVHKEQAKPQDYFNSQKWSSDEEDNCKVSYSSPRSLNYSKCFNTTIPQIIPISFSGKIGRQKTSDFSETNSRCYTFDQSISSEAVSSPIGQQKKACRSSTQVSTLENQATSDSTIVSSQIDEESHYANGQQTAFTNQSGVSLTDSQMSSNQSSNLANQANESAVTRKREQKEEEKKKKPLGRPYKGQDALYTGQILEMFVLQNRAIMRQMKRIFLKDKKLQDRIKALLGESDFDWVYKKFENCRTIPKGNQQELSILQMVCYSYSKEAMEMFFNVDQYRVIFNEMRPDLENADYRTKYPREMAQAIQALYEISDIFELVNGN